ncbi:PREDICTED: uncharacterized protein LOC109583290 isoform X2 [Amphimedon queenslandica]|nr:PREDICTED: uncharacterized protein LOC109583290 isoform X2 [Amphimedon queenslandica]|eukprot:XP_019854121.1 PREDICTED: uncharacterized protein LOC109583290 isoform X2 [Amphimedon queenslandica]
MAVGNNEKVDDFMTVKFKADLLFYKGDYGDALKIYKDILTYLPHTYGQVTRELQDSIVHCYLNRNEEKRVEEEEELLEWARLLVSPPHEKDASSWQLLAECYMKGGDMINETLSRGQCCLLQRHYPEYWTELGSAYYKLHGTWSQELARDYSNIDKLLQLTVSLFKPYIRKVERTQVEASYVIEPHEVFIKFLSNCTMSTHTIEREENVSSILLSASCCCLIWSKQLLFYSMSHSGSFARSVQSIKYQEVESNLTKSGSYTDRMITELTESMIKASMLDL